MKSISDHKAAVTINVIEVEIKSCSRQFLVLVQYYNNITILLKGRAQYAATLEAAITMMSCITTHTAFPAGFMDHMAMIGRRMNAIMIDTMQYKQTMTMLQIFKFKTSGLAY